MLCACCISIIFVSTVLPETLRERASSYFSRIEWVDSAALSVRSASPSRTIPGGNETFALLKPAEDRTPGTVYPEIDGLGKLDYSELPAGLRSFMQKAAAELVNGSITQKLCLPEYTFLPVLVSYQLSQLPAVESVAYSRPVIEESGLYSAIFRLKLRTDKDDSWCFASGKMQKKDSEWYLQEFIFDGATYAEFARQN